jgi:hypothetical protein
VCLAWNALKDLHNPDPPAHPWIPNRNHCRPRPLHGVMQIPYGNRGESSNSLNLRDLDVADRTHQAYHHGIPNNVQAATASTGLHMSSKFLPGPSQLLSADNFAGNIDTHNRVDLPYYPRSSPYNHPQNTTSADFGSRYGGHHSQVVSPLSEPAFAGDELELERISLKLDWCSRTDF